MDVVVGVAVVDRGRVLAARRWGPPPLAGRWEFPGGKVEPGERPEAAAVREIAEELGCDVEVTGWLDGEVPVRAGLVLTVATARLVARDPVPAEHDAVRWLAVGELAELGWVEADLPFVDLLREHLPSDHVPTEHVPTEHGPTEQGPNEHGLTERGGSSR